LEQQLRDAATTYSVFQEPWWLDAVSPGNWDAVEIIDNGQVSGWFPFVLEKRFGLRMLNQPALTQTLGPWVSESSESKYEKLSREHSTFKQLINKLPAFDHFHQRFHPSLTNLLTFQWEGFQQNTRYTYVLDGIEDVETTYKQFLGKQRSAIKSASNKLKVIEDVDIDTILNLATHTFERQGRKLPYPRELLHRIDEAVQNHGFRVAVKVVDEYGEIHSAGYVVGDSRRAYLLVTGQDPRFRGSGSGELMHWELIKAASAYTSVFDFEGSMLEGVERFYRRFNSKQVPYSSIEKSNSKATIAKKLNGILGKLK
jgi:lipid II:glycine glycyltransferase (peptidoglycan interpeptide bridge formation enzyme)